MIKKIAITLAVLLFLLVFVITALLMTTPGLCSSIAVANHFIPGTITYTKLSGSVASGLHADTITYHDNDTVITLKNVTSNWQLLNILQDEIDINFAADYQSLSFSTQINGSSKQYRLALNITGKDSDWHLTGEGNSEQLTFKTTKPTLLGGSASLAGTLALKQLDQSQGQWQINMPALSSILPTLAGSLASQGQYNNMHFTGTLNGRDLHIDDYTVEALSSRFDIYTNDTGHSSISLTTHDVSNGAFQKVNIIANASGNKDSFSGTASLQKQSHKLLAAIKGNLSGDTTNILLNTLTITNGGTWRLKNPVDMTFGNIISISPMCLVATDQQICLSTEWHARALAGIDFNASQVKLSMLNLLMPTDVSLQGLLNGHGQIDVSDRSQAGELHATLDAASITYPGPEGQETWRFPVGKMNANFNDKGIDTQITLAGEKQEELIATFSFPNVIIGQPTPEPMRISGTIRGSIADIGLLPAFAPSIEHVKGKLAANLQLGGTVKKPTLKGSVTLSNGSFFVPDADISINQINLTATGNTDTVHYTLTAKSGGTLTAEGTTKLNAKKHFPTSLKVTGDNILLSNSHELMLVASPNLAIEIAKLTVSVNGTVTIPKARISPTDFSSVQTLPNDVVFVGNPEKAAEEKPITKWITKSDVTVILGKDVAVDVKGVTGKLKGQLELAEPGSGQAKANGQIALVDGKFNAYGQKLTIPKGIASYTGGPVDNPNIDIVATRTIKNTTIPGQSSKKDITVGLRVTGSLENYTTQLFSRPAGVSDTDILSFLILGHPSSEADQSGASILLAAASSLAVSNSDGTSITDELKDTFGLEKLAIETPDANSGTSDGNEFLQRSKLALGKYLSPKLYVEYSMGILDQSSTFKVRYYITDKWQVQTKTNTEGNGVDLLYTFER